MQSLMSQKKASNNKDIMMLFITTCNHIAMIFTLLQAHIMIYYLYSSVITALFLSPFKSFNCRR